MAMVSTNIQDEINYDADGSYNFKGIYCATAAKRIAKDFTDSSSDYAIRYVRDNPRNPEDEPDAFETEALQAFRNSGTTEYYGKDVVNGQPVFRYVSLLTVEKAAFPATANQLDRVTRRDLTAKASKRAG